MTQTVNQNPPESALSRMPGSRLYEYPVTCKNSTVLGYGVRNRYHPKLWAELDWRKSYRDRSGVHILNVAGGEYLHVRCLPSKDMDGPGYIPVRERRWYRVRCWLYAGRKWRGGIVSDVKVNRKSGRWVWAVTVSANDQGQARR